MGFSAPAAGQHTYGSANSAGAVTTVSATALTNTPTSGNLLVIGVFFGGSSTPTLSIADNNGKTYTQTPNSPSNAQLLNAGVIWLAYRLADGTEGKTVTATFGTAGDLASIYVDEFGVSGGTASFDADNAGSGASGTAINTPTVTVNGSNELVYAMAVPNHSINGVGTFTVIESLPETFGEAAAYILSQTGNKTLDWTVNVGGQWDSMGASFAFTATPVVVSKIQTRQIRPAPFKPMGDAFRTAKYGNWR